MVIVVEWGNENIDVIKLDQFNPQFVGYPRGVRGPAKVSSVN